MTIQLELPFEIWRPVADAPVYFVSSYGRVRGTSGRILKPRPNDKGYMRVTLALGPDVRLDRYIHDLVLRAFVGPRPSPEHEADHQDDDRGNNRLSNLQWLTLAENRARRKVARGEANGQAKLLAHQVRSIRSIHGRTDAAIARDFGISRRQIGDIRNGIAWAHIQ